MSDPASIPAFTVAIGHVEVPVALIKGGQELAKVAILKVDFYSAFFRVINDEYALADLVCEQAPGWSKNLMPDSLMDVVEKAGELNFSPARRWVARREMLDQVIASAAPVNAAN